MGELTILRSASGALATKRHTRREGTVSTEPYGRGMLSNVETRTVENIRELNDVLVSLIEDRFAFIIGGRPRDGGDLSKPVVRRLHARAGVAATFSDPPRRWICLDIDNLVAPGIDVIRDPLGALRFALDHLRKHAPEFRDANPTCFATFSASAGVRDVSNVKCHLFFWLARSYSSDELKRWAAEINARAGTKLIDSAVFNAVQPIYVARPLFDGMADPLPGDRRYALIEGARDEVELIIPAPTLRPASIATSDANYRAGGGFAFHVAAFGGARGLRQPALAAIAAEIGRLGSERASRERASIVAKVAAALRAAPRGERAEATVEKYIVDLDAIYDWVLTRQRESEGKAVEPTYSDNGVSLDVAETIVHDGVFSFLDEAEAAFIARQAAKASGRELGGAAPPAALILPSPAVVGIQAALGIGKSRAVADWIGKAEKAQQSGVRLAILQDRHKLLDECAERLERRGVSGHVWRGEDQIDPTTGGSMCQKLELRRAARRVGDADAACKPCTARDRCSYRAQRTGRATVELGAHNFLYQKPPKRFPDVTALVIDESPIDKALAEGVMLVSALKGSITGLPWIDQVALAESRAKVIRILERAIEAGKLTRGMIDAEGLTAAECVEAQTREWLLKPRLKIDDVSEKQAMAIFKAAAASFSPNVPKFWQALQAFIESGESESALIEPVSELVVGEAGSGPGVHFRWLRSVHPAWENTPRLYLDATMSRALLKIFEPTIEICEPIEVNQPPHAQVEQLVEPLPTSALIDLKTGAPKPKLREAADRIEILARRYFGAGTGEFDLLIVGTKAVEAALLRLLEGRDIERSRIAIRHFGDLTGENRYEGVRAVVTLGWPLAPAGAIERDAAVLTGKRTPCEIGAGAWPMAEGGLRMRNGTGRRVSMPRHVDDIVEAARWQRTEGWLLQALGRARPIRRTKDRPLDLHIWSPVPLPGITVDRGVTWGDVAPSRLELLASRRGVVPGRPADLFRAGGGLWRSPAAAEADLKRELRRGVTSDISLRELFLRAMSEVSYRHPGTSPWSRAWITSGLEHLAETLLRRAAGTEGIEVRRQEGPPRPPGSRTKAALAAAASHPPASATAPHSGTAQVVNRGQLPPAQLDLGAQGVASAVQAGEPRPQAGRPCTPARIDLVLAATRSSEAKGGGVARTDAVRLAVLADAGDEVWIDPQRDPWKTAIQVRGGEVALSLGRRPSTTFTEAKGNL